MTESWDDYAAGWEENESVITYSREAFASLNRIVKVEGLRIFDFGCGTGLLTEQMTQYAEHVVALDPSQKMVLALKSKCLQNVDTIIDELTEQTFKQRSDLESDFDLVVASSVCAFLTDYQSTLELLKRLLKPSGRFIQWDWFKSDEGEGFGFTEGEIEAAFQKAGLKVISTSIPFSLEAEGQEMRVVMCVGENA